MNKIIGILLFVAVLPLPMGYYDLLRIIVSIGAVLNIFGGRSIFIPILIIFNPIIPVYLYDKAIWAIIDIVSGMIFFASDEEEL